MQRYRYYYCKEPTGERTGFHLVDDEQMVKLERHLNVAPKEFHSSVIDHDINGSQVGCYLYFDIDDTDLLSAYEQMREIVDIGTGMFDCEPVVYFSGSKGFHIFFPTYIRHERCHLVAKIIALEVTRNIDDQVYRTKGFLRSPFSWNSKGRKWKVPIEPTWQLDRILAVAAGRERCAVTCFDKWKHVELDISEYVAQLPKYSDVASLGGELDFRLRCLDSIWLDDVDEGQRHRRIYLFARYFMAVGLTAGETIDKFKEHMFWSKIDEHDFIKVINSTYSNGKAMIGCKSGCDAELMQSRCSELCPFNVKFPVGIRWDS